MNVYDEAIDFLASAENLSADVERLKQRVTATVDEVVRLRQQRDILFAAAKLLQPAAGGGAYLMVRTEDLQRLAAAVAAVEQAQRDAAARGGSDG